MFSMVIIPTWKQKISETVSHMHGNTENMNYRFNNFPQGSVSGRYTHYLQ